jgi:hypothetical protein
MTEEQTYLWGKRHETLYRVELSLMYHHRRERFFVLLDRTTKALAVIFGSAAFANLGGSEMVRWSAAVITITSTLALVAGLTERAQRHAVLAGDYGRLAASIIGCGERGFTETDLNRWLGQQRSIEVGEPRPLTGLVALCQNDLAIAQGHPELVVRRPWYTRCLAQWVDLPASVRSATT